MKPPSRTALTIWAAITILVAASLVLVRWLRGAHGWQDAIQTGPLTDLTITLYSVSAAWLLIGLALYLIAFHRMNTDRIFRWGGFFLIAAVYLNILRER